MRRLFDITEQITNGIDYGVHATRGEFWEDNLRTELESRKQKAADMLRNDTPNNIFKIAGLCKLPVLVVRDLEREYLNDINYKGEAE
ncbi:hypothetical protein COJ96_09125 [Bacillus sp. AFS073361]|uniref:hypothetical protein n=1 Tax=Bacillus sp. AFS073361 TaxID=2033511 RepID=UPI000BF5708A|nr:hypothetical protein [Bacillus sp. AFS073361]PFP29835.1 hypothetical protein COJ96_09125 [Bacillus sp. AFS073361]